jgi:hypothetical protein
MSGWRIRPLSQMSDWHTFLGAFVTGTLILSVALTSIHDIHEFGKVLPSKCPESHLFQLPQKSNKSFLYTTYFTGIHIYSSRLYKDNTAVVTGAFDQTTLFCILGSLLALIFASMLTNK